VVNFPPPKIGRISKDSVVVGEEVLVKIFIEEASDLKIVDAFFDCELVAPALVDTSTYKISGCSKGLIVENDTIVIAFEAMTPGVKEFSEITILTKDIDRVFRTFKYSFGYTVVPD